MNKRWLLALLFGAAFSQVCAQQNNLSVKRHSISGILKDSLSGAPLPSATISLLFHQKDSVLKNTTSDANGKFALHNIVPGHYTLRIASVGYETYRQYPVVVTNNISITSLGPISLLKKDQTLETVTVVARTKLIDNRIDKMVYNAEKDLSAQTGVATDLLKKVPQVSVDVDGNVELSGSSSIRFLINGKSSTAFGSNIAEVLQSIPASQIKSIEVVTNPGAKYDAEGLGGVINIILKKNTAKGINTNVSLTAGSLLQNGSVNVAVREGNFGVHGFISSNVKLPATSYKTSHRVSVDSIQGTSEILDQSGTGRFRRHGIESGIGFDWTVKKKNNFSASVGRSLYAGNGTSTSSQEQVLNDFGGNKLSDISLMNYSGWSYRSVNTEASFDYKRTFDKDDKSLDFSVNTGSESNANSAFNEQYRRENDSLVYGTHSLNPSTVRQTELRLDYTQPFCKRIILSAGGKTTFTTIDNRSDIQLSGTDGYQYDSALSNSLIYHQYIYALYSELTFPVGSLFDVKAGARYERTNRDVAYSQLNTHTEVPDYSTLAPSIYFSKKMDHGQVVKVSVTKRIQRPNYDDLNPFVNTTDPKNISMGNPELKPEIGKRYEISYSRDISSVGTVMAALFYRNSHNDIQPYVTYYPEFTAGDSVYQNVSVSTRENIGTEKNAGLNLFSDVHVNSKLSWRTNIFLFHRHIENDLDENAYRNSFNYRFNLNATYLFSPLITGEFSGNFNSARNEAQGRYPSWTTYSMALRKLFASKKGSIAFTASNPFNNYIRQPTEIFGNGFTQTSMRRIPYRSFGLNFTWKFGKLEFKKEQKDDTDEKDPVSRG